MINTSTNTQQDISVVMSAHNAERTISRAIESVLSQTFTNWNMVVVDDGSTDGTRNVIAGYAAVDQRIMPMFLDENHGLPYCLNQGITATSAPLIARMDADDESLPERLEKQRAFMHNHPEIDVLGSAAIYVPANHPEQEFLQRMPESHKDLVKRIYRMTPFIHPTTMFKRSYIEQADGYDERLQHSEDLDLWLRTYKWATFHNLLDPLLRYSYVVKPSFARCTENIPIVASNAYRNKEFHRALIPVLVSPLYYIKTRMTS